MDWINSQSNLMDSIRYLIENEVRHNGVRNLQQLIPAERSGYYGVLDAVIETAASQAELRTPDLSASVMDPRLSLESAFVASAQPVEERMELSEDDIDEDDIDSWG